MKAAVPETRRGQLSDIEANLNCLLARCDEPRTLAIRVEPFEFEIFCVAWDESALEVHLVFKTQRAERESTTRALCKQWDINLNGHNLAVGPQLVAVLPRSATTVASLLIALIRNVYRVANDVRLYFMLVLMEHFPGITG